MPQYGFQFWKKAPFIRLLLSLIAGILVQRQIEALVFIWYLILATVLGLVILFFFVPFFTRYRFSWAAGMTICVAFLAMGALLTWHQDIRNNRHWMGNFYKETDAMVVTLAEPPVEKTSSMKAEAIVGYLIHNKMSNVVKGKIIVYFKKDSLLPELDYGSQVIFKKQLQEIRNSGNPGGFNYKQYCLYRGITHQVYLLPGEFEVLPGKKKRWLDQFLYATREKVLTIIRENIKGDKEAGLAEALLIGYKNDLDKPLVQSYTNTGVVHIIAISGLHIGLIFGLLSQICKPLQKRKKLKWLRALLIVSGLWLFSLLAGAQPSVLRSALMFTCIVTAESLVRRSSILNSLAVSAFILLCINPYWLWDVGFQLSYAAVLSIVIFFRPVYNWFYIKNKLLDHIWKLNAVTIAAQILTVPLSIYHFHQFPNYFLLTNFIAVPLSGAIILGEIVLCAVSIVPALALAVGKILYWLIWLMNTYIKRIEGMPFSLWDGLQVNIPQAILLMIAVAGASYWLMEKKTRGFFTALIALSGFFALRSYSFIRARRQQKIIIYNVPKRNAMDFIDGRNYLFIGDSAMLTDDFVRNFHLKPARTYYRITSSGSLNNLLRYDEHYIRYQNKNILLVDEPVSFRNQEIKPVIDLMIISKNPGLHMPQLASVLTIRQVVFDGSVPGWKVNYWKKDCDSLHIPCYDVSSEGAFVMNLQ